MKFSYDFEWLEKSPTFGPQQKSPKFRINYVHTVHISLNFEKRTPKMEKVKTKNIIRNFC